MPELNIANPSSAQNFADKAATSADTAIRSTQRVTNDAFDSLSGGVQNLRQQAAPAMEHLNDVAQRSVDTVRDRARQLRERAMRVQDTTVYYIKDEPVKAMLIAERARSERLVQIIKEMQRQTKTRLQIPTECDPMTQARLCTMTGTDEGIEAMKAMISSSRTPKPPAKSSSSGSPEWYFSTLANASVSACIFAVASASWPAKTVVR